MNAPSTISHILHTFAGRPFLIDVTYQTSGIKKPVVIFVHGFKGFKDWGPFPLMSQYFATNGFVCVKVNLSHNGTTPEKPMDFSDLEAFGHNTFSQQLEDLNHVLDFVETSNDPLLTSEIDPAQIFLLGHSRGGSLVLLKAAEDSRIRKVATWAAVADLKAGYTEDELALWKSQGVQNVFNGRTQQTMPQYYDFYADLLENDKRLTVMHAVKHLPQPLFIVHGDADETVSIEDAKSIHAHAQHSELLIVQGAGHTFDGKHPFTETDFTSAFREALDATIRFFKHER